MDVFQEDLFQDLIDRMPVGVVVYEYDRTLRVCCFNDMVCQITGYSRKEYEERFLTDAIKIAPEEDRRELEEKIENAADAGRDMSVVHRIVRRDGTVRWIQVYGKELYREENRKCICAVYVDVTEKHEQLAQMRYRAEHDLLTGAYNMERFCLEAERILHENKDRQYVIVKYDIHRFKIINELFGREIGDKILLAMTERIAQRAGEHGCYGRIGGDMFVMLVPYEELHAEELEEDRVHVLEELGLTFDVSLYIGIYAVENIDDPVPLMCDRAQLALQSVKGNYMTRHAFYQDSLRKEVIGEQELLSDMKEAMESGQLCAYYQPIFNASDQKVVGAEALVRWRHPGKGMIPPDQFIPLFERNGFVVRMDWYVWEQVCILLQRQQGEGVMCPVSVNVSRIHLYNRNFPAELYELVCRYEIDPRYLRLEITESAYMDNAEQLLEAIGKLQAYGFEIMMDDFGSGYSSLNMLKDVPVNILKIDRMFMKDIGASGRAEQVIVSIIHVARILRMEIVAEGVETEQQYLFLRDNGCDYIQGFYFGRPVPEEEYQTILVKSLSG